MKDEWHEVHAKARRPDPQYRAWLCGPFRLERRVGEGYEPVGQREWGGHTSPRTILKALLCAPGRQMRRSALAAELWPEASEIQASREMSVALTFLRKVLRSNHGEEVLTEEGTKGLKLAGQDLLWNDADAASHLLDQAEQMGAYSPAALPLLEEALNYFERGLFLEDDEGEWMQAQRALWERRRYRCRLRLAEIYGQQGRLERAESILNDLLRDDPFDEDVICRLILLLQQQGLAHQALVVYRQASVFFEEEGMELTEATRELAACLHTQKQAASLDKRTLQPPAFNSLPIQGIIESNQAATPLSKQSIEEQSMDVSRRNFLYSLGIAGIDASFGIAQHFQGLPVRAFPRISDASIHDLASITARLRTLQRQGDIPIFDELTAHLSVIQNALNATMDDRQRRDLWRILAQTQLIGRLSPFPKQDLAKAKMLNEAAIAAARNSGDMVLIGAAIGHFAHFYLRIERDPLKTFQLLEQAQGYIQGQKALDGWFTILRASIASLQDKPKECEALVLAALEVADQTQDHIDPYFTDFNITSVQVFAGNCLLAVQEPQKALKWLSNANLDDLSPNRHASTYYDLARAYAASGQLEAAQEYALKSMDCALATNNLYIIPRFVPLARAIQQKYPGDIHASTLVEYALSALYAQERTSL